MGLLDFNDPIQQFGLGLLAASGPSNRPFSWGNAIASGAGQVMDWQDKQLARQLREQQLQLNKMTIDDHAVSLAQKQLREKLLNSDALPDEIRTRLMLGGSPDKAFEDMAQQAFMKKALPLLGGQEVEAARPYQAEMADSMAAMPDKRFDVSTPEAQQKLQDDFARLEQIDPKQAALVREQLVQQGLIKPKTTITQPDWQRIGQLGVATQLAGVKGGDAMMKLAEMYQPNTMTVDTGNGQLLVNKNTGTPVGLGFLPKGMSPNEVQVNDRENAKLNFELPGGYRTPSANSMPQQPQGSGSSNPLSAKQQAEITASGVKGFNENWLKNTYQPVQDAGNNAQSIQAQVQTLRNIPINTGWGTEAQAAGANVLTGLGIAPKSAEMLATNAQRFQQVAMERLWTTLNAAKGPQTEGDAERAKQTFASLKNTPQANQFILDMAEANANRDAMKASFYRDAYALAKQTGEFDRVDREWSKVNRSIWSDPIMQKWKVK